MVIFSKKITLHSKRMVTFHDITERVSGVVEESMIENGIVVVYSPHTTCSVLIQESAHDIYEDETDLLMQDLLNVLEKITPAFRDNGEYLHPGSEHLKVGKKLGEKTEWSKNTDAHLRSLLLGRSESIPVINGRIELGDFGRIYLADFDQVRARKRSVVVQISGE